ncbi:MAG: hypothetical protein A2233_02865 [Candidatus Kerfeldbacteria bacterium RIFOXYA2_FULL_38_24]|nr:MAG: hypothetical protein A2233_02865 [Candidatus Kerfeldbacteria bacterium RIFOXYA2_FULL_38_24]
MLKNFLIFSFFLLFLPGIVFGKTTTSKNTSPAVQIDLFSHTVTFGAKTITYDSAKDLQAVRLERQHQYYLAVLRFQKNILRLDVYNQNGKKIDTEKIAKAPGGQDFSSRQLSVVTVNDHQLLKISSIKTNEKQQPIQYLVKKYRINPDKKRIIKYKSAFQKDIVYPNLSSLTDADAMLKLLNYYRQASGLLPLKRYADLDSGCQQHAQYMASNNILEHYEEEGRPGYSDEGNTAGGSSNVARLYKDASMVSALQKWLNGTYHRLLLMYGGLYGTGFAVSGPSSTNYYYSCLNILTKTDIYTAGQETNVTYADLANTNPVLTPGVNEVNVPTTLTAGEWPDPLAKFGGHYPAGYPITVIFGSLHYFSEVNLRLFKLNGEQVFAYFQKPGDQTDPNILYQNNAYSLIPAAPLATHNTYRVRLDAKRDSQPYTFDWYFTTQ